MSKQLVAKREARKVTVKRSTKSVHIPIKTGITPNIRLPHEKIDSCVVRRGAFGWGWHECPYHLIYIEEAA
jgi:hypothetical protein